MQLELLKSFNLQKKILDSLKNYSSLKKYFLQEHLNLTLNSIKIIFELFKNEKNIINCLINFYKEFAQDIGESCISNINSFNEIFINYYKSSEDNYNILELLKLLYSSLLNLVDRSNDLYLEINKYVLDNYFLIMTTFMGIVFKGNDNIVIKEKIKILSEFHYYIFKKLDFNSSLYVQDNESEKYYYLINKIIEFLINCINYFKQLEIKEPVNEATLISVIESFNSFFINISLSKNILTQNINNTSLYIEIILSSIKIIQFKQCKYYSKKHLLIFYQNAIEYDINSFIVAFKKYLSETNKFTPNFIENIINYFQFFQNNRDNIEKMISIIFDSIPGDKNIDNKKFNNLFILNKKKKKLFVDFYLFF